MGRMAKENVKLTNECCPQHLRTGTAIMTASEDEGKQESGNKKQYKITYGKQAQN